MKVITTITKYLIWLLLSIFSGMGWMRIELGKSIEATGFLAVLNGLDKSIIIWIGGFIGSISFIPFVLIDLFYIQRKIGTKLNQNITKIFSVFILTGIAALIHYVLEFTLNWI